MKYRFNYAEAVIEFQKNEGRALIDASSPEEALSTARSLFSSIRSEIVEQKEEDHFLVSFKVSFDYRLHALRDVERALRTLSDAERYGIARFIDRYIVATVCFETDKPEWLAESQISLKREISDMRKSAIVSREVANIRDYVDWDIAIHNYIELNSKDGFQSRVIRDVGSSS